jgi:hypothetical protein
MVSLMGLLLRCAVAQAYWETEYASFGFLFEAALMAVEGAMDLLSIAFDP